MLAEMASPREIGASLPRGDFHDYVTLLLSAEVEDVTAWRALFDARVDLVYLEILRDAGATDFVAVASAWADGIPVDYAVAILGAQS